LKTIGELQLLPVWVNPSHRVSSAKILLAGHRLRALGVIEGGLLIGTIGYEELVSASDQDEVARFLKPLGLVLSPEERVREVAARMASEGLDYMPVADRGRFIGILTSTMLLRDVSRSWDPLTGLSWSDALRDWGIQQLREGHEVTILFIDLDNFGQYNKKYGHIVGDRVLLQVARFLNQTIDEATDVVVRYGGDEFAIATVRSRRDTERLLGEIESGIQGAHVSDAEQPITLSAGIFGGRRSKERENIHYSATLDSLINMASRAAQATKEAKKVQPSKEPQGEAMLPAARSEFQDVEVVEVFSSGDSSSALETVILSRKDKVASGVQTRGSSTRVESVVLAAAKALERLTEGIRFEMGEVQLSECENGKRFVAISGTVHYGGQAPRSVTAARGAENDLYKAVAEATIEAALS